MPLSRLLNPGTVGQIVRKFLAFYVTYLYGLFIDAVSTINYRVYNGILFNEQRIVKDL